MKRLLAMLLALMMVLSVFAACTKPADDVNNGGNDEVVDNGDNGEETPDVPEREVVTFDANKSYVYKDSVSTMATNWNPHTYQTTDDSYPAEFLRSGLYSFLFNDELHAKEGKDPYSGYVIVPEMAASEPVDVTETVKAEHPEFGIPESATKGYAYTIDLNPNACWEDGTPINADTYVYSMQKLLDPKLINYRATDYYAGDFCIAGAEAFNLQGSFNWTNFTPLGMSAEEYIAQGGDMSKVVLDMSFWGISSADNKGFDYITDDRMIRDNSIPEGEPEDYVSAKYLYDTYLAPGMPYAAYAASYLGTADKVEFGAVDYDGTVGLYKSGDYQITLVLAKSLTGFNLLYNLSGNWIVKEDLYEANLKETNGVWSSTYNTSVETTSSYGPYKLTDYQTDKHMRFERNENWWGYTDGLHTYVDPTDGKEYPMYMTTAIDTQVVAESATRKLMFLKGELMGYGLQAEDMDTYRSSDFCYATPSETIFFLILNGHKESIKTREAAADFDKNTLDLESMTNLNFRKAVAISYDRDLFAATISPARSGGYGIIGTNYIYDPETGAKYRDTDQAKQALCTFYSVDVDAFESLDEAAASITGYDPVKAAELFNLAFTECLAEGFITDNDGNGVSDQTVRIEYCISSDSDFMTKTVNYLNEKIKEVTKGTGFDGKIEFVKSAPYGNEWSNKIREGLADTVLGGWSGSALNPFSLTDLYVNPENAYDAAWFNATTVEMTMEIDGETITMNLYQWSDALNGETVEVNGKEYNFGDGMAPVETRLNILANFEVKVLETYDYLPMLQDGGMSLLSQQVYYVVEEYNPIMGRGGITYLKYNYDETEWTNFVTEQGGELKY